MSKVVVTDPKRPRQLFFRGAGTRHVGGHHELLEVDRPVAVSIENPENLEKKNFGTVTFFRLT